MADLYLLTDHEYPDRLTGTFQGYVIRGAEQRDILAVEDRLHQQTGEMVRVSARSLLILPDVNLSRSPLEEYATLAEFAMYILVADGSIGFLHAATFTGPACSNAWVLREKTGPPPLFTETVTGEYAAKWIARCVLSRDKLQKRFHITADRYIRYRRASNLSDSLLDLCICLESTLDTQTEIAFKFSILLGRFVGGRGEEGERVARILQSLYDLRSKISHGDPAAEKALGKLRPELPELDRIAKRLVSEYILFTGDKKREDWLGRLRSELFA